MNLVLTFSLTAVLATFMLAGCRDTAAAAASKDSTAVFDITAIRPIIEGKDEAWAKAITGLDSAAMVNHYTKDGKIFPPNGDAVVGRTAISAFISEVLKFGIKEYKDQTTALYGNGDNLIEEGIYSMGDGKGNTIDKGKYIAVWRKEDGEWKIYSNIFNTSLPAAQVKK
jgi:uncharacterized protein (TIGR02246 family)